MARLRSYVDIFFNYRDAVDWVEKHLFEVEEGEGFVVKELEIKLMDSGAYRAGVIFTDQPEQFDLFGAEQDA